VKLQTGKTAKKLIQDRLTLEIKRLMSHSDLSNKEIAYEMNFNDPAYFSRYFKKHVGCSSAEFREKTKKKGITNT
jgi:AraC-like DNA-binding protein